MQLFKDFSVSTLLAGAVTVLVGFTTSVAIVFQAAHASGAGTAGAASWIWALGVGMGVTCIALSLQFRIPVVTAWSTAGAAMLITSAPAFSAGEVVGAFVAASALTMWVGFGGIFQRFMHRVPLPLAAGMLKTANVPAVALAAIWAMIVPLLVVALS